MPKRGLPQEGLKLIACATMLLDHIGATIVNDLFYAAADTGSGAGSVLLIQELLRSIGRLAFPIYCFLLVEGSVRTRNPKGYGLRLLIAAVLSEAPYDFAFYGGMNWQRQSVMVTLLIGFVMLEALEKCPQMVLKLLVILPFAWMTDAMNSDYGADGILVIALFALTRELSHKRLLQFFGLWCIFSPSHLMMINWFGSISITIQELAVFAIVPIWLYDGRKVTKSKMVQWAFYLFYPVHLMTLYLIGRF